MSQFNKLTEEEKIQWKHAIGLALEKLIDNGWDARNDSKKFDVFYKANRIPPKEVIAKVFEYFDTNKIITNITSVSGGDKDTNELLRDFGLEVVEKKISLKELLKKIDVWHTWRDNYKKYVPNFIEEVRKGLNYSEWEADVFNEFFEKSNNQCVSSLRQGYFTLDEKKLIKENWNKVTPIMQDIVNSEDRPAFKQYQVLKQLIRKYTKQDRRAATNRLIASIQPNFLCTIVNQENLNTLISYLNKFVLNADIKIQLNWFESSYAVHKFFLKEGGFKDSYEMITYPWQLFEYFNGNHHLNDNDMSEQQINNEIIDLLKYKKQIILQGPPGTGKTKLAKEVAEHLLELSGKKIEQLPTTINETTVKSLIKCNVKFKSVSGYSDYEVVKIENDSFIVKTHKTGNEYPAKISKIIDYYEDQNWSKSGSKKNDNDSYEAAIAKYLYDTLEVIPEIETLKNTKRLHILQFHPSYTYEDFVRGIVSEAKEDRVVYQAKNRVLVEMANKAVLNPNHNYLLILDEINRANLSAVLGELIYALEYRGKEVNSMYEVKGTNKITLPNNLYIIGTMNTADRSVGHIDYAIRRRFAFVDVLPQNLIGETDIIFDDKLFNTVKALFTADEYITRSEYLSQEFDPKDVALGHSYFIDKSKEGGSMNIRLEYEIKPILFEYVKDGVLIGDTIKNLIEDLKPSI